MDHAPDGLAIRPTCRHGRGPWERMKCLRSRGEMPDNEFVPGELTIQNHKAADISVWWNIGSASDLPELP